jgi:hypothetical protein
MEVKKAVELVRRMELEIADVIAAQTKRFEELTGLSVSSISISTIDVTTFDSARRSVIGDVRVVVEI